MEIGELQQILAQAPASLRVESYASFCSVLRIALEVGDGPPLLVALRDCGSFAGAMQGRREPLSLERSEEGWSIVGETTLVTFMKLLGRCGPPVPSKILTADELAASEAEGIKILDEVAMTRSPPQLGDLDSDGMRKPHDEPSLVAYFAAAPVNLGVLSYGADWAALQPREMYTCVRRGRALDFSALMLQDVTFFSGDLTGRRDCLSLHRGESGYEIVGPHTRVCFRTFFLGKGSRAIRVRAV